MEERPAPASIILQLRALCEAHPTARKVVFVPRVQIGQALEVAVARHTGGWAGLACRTPLHYAQEMARWDAARSGRRELPPAGVCFLAADLVDQLGDSSLTEDLPASHSFAGSVARSIENLRRNGVAPERLRERAAAPEASRALRMLAECCERYHARLDDDGLYDDADVMTWAARCVREDTPPEVPETIYAVCGATDLPDLAFRWLAALRKHGAAFYRIGVPTPGEAPQHTAAALFADASLPKGIVDTGIPNEETPVRVRRAVGAENEVRGLWREILAQKLPLDEVEIACASSRPYLPLVADLAEQMGVAVTLGTGLPALQTRTGQALHGFYAWIQEDFDVRRLIHLLRSGLLRVDRALRRQGSEEGLAAHEVATVLAGRRYESGRGGYDKAFAVAREDAQAAVERCEERGVDAERNRARLRTLGTVQHLVKALLDLAPRHAGIQDVASASQRFLEHFGPVDAADAKPEEERTMEEAARSVLYQKLGKLARLPFSYEALGARLAGMLQEALAEQFVRSARPRPGAAHVLPLESAGYTGRRHLFVLGMDSNTLSVPAHDQMMLHDADRVAVGAGLEGAGLPARRDAADEALWRIERALHRHRSALTLYANVFDVGNGEERFPAPFFLEAETAADEEVPTVGFLPETDETALPIDDRACWLSAYAAGKGGEVSREPTARDALEAEWPGVLAGAEARRACGKEAYTCHDGLLAEGAYPELGFTDAGYGGPPLSASRLETFAETPYLYFLKYVLGIESLDEPALDEAAWLDPRRRGGLLHRCFEQFMKDLDGEPVTARHADALLEALDEGLASEGQRLAPPSERVEAATRRALHADALIFLQAEAEAAERAEPLHHELGFGYGARHRQDGDHGSVTLELESGLRLPLRGRIDRVDRLEGGALAVWDYKTGRAASFSQNDPLGAGAHLQWALYGYVMAELSGETVRRSGYFFTTAKEMGLRLCAEPEPYRDEVERIIERLGEMAQRGCFPMNPKAKDLNSWKWRGYDGLFADLEERSRQLRGKRKDYPEDRPSPLFL